MDILKFLIIIAVIAIPIIKEVRKNKAKQADTPPPMPKKPAEVFLPGEENDTLPKAFKKNKKQKTTSTQTVRANTIAPATPLLSDDTPTTDQETDIAIRSAEDARRAVIWSEILNKKY